VSHRLKQAIAQLLQARVGSSELTFASQPGVVLVVGVNGGGKTTTIGKLAHKLTREGARVLVVPGDTFRAAAGEQLAVWATRAGATFHEAPEGSRPSTVMYTAVDDVLTGRQPCDIILGDTSGRLHTNAGLMEELAKVKKTVTKRYPEAPHETLLVLDGTTGLNMLAQAREFNAAVGLTGLILTKLDGSARGGAVVSVVDELGLPVKFIGVGETIDDLQPFDARAFVDALFDEQGLKPQ
jgi:fused signal recognition particle receptor